MDAAMESFQPLILALNTTYVSTTSLLTPYLTPETFAPLWAVVPPQFVSFAVIVAMALGTMSLALHHAVTTDASSQDVLTDADAASLPLTGSAVLVGLYVVLALLPRALCMDLVALYLTLASTLAARDLLCGPSPTVCKATLGVALGVVYAVVRGAVWNDVHAVALAVTAVRSVRMSFGGAAAMVGGLFAYDVFWVYGTDVMTTVALAIDGPVKFIVDFTHLGGNRAILGLGDVIVPGLFGGVVRRFEKRLNEKVHLANGKEKRTSKAFGRVLLLAYTASLIHTVVVAVTQNHAQPALLFIVPWMLGAVLITAAVKGVTRELILFEDGGKPQHTQKRKNVKLEDATVEELHQRLLELDVSPSFYTVVRRFFGLEVQETKEKGQQKGPKHAPKDATKVVAQLEAQPAPATEVVDAKPPRASGATAPTGKKAKSSASK